MKRAILIIAVLAFAGCVTPRYARNWGQVSIGMSRPEVKEVLGTPKFQSVVSPEVTQSAAALIFGSYPERWDYRKRKWFTVDLDGMCGPPANAFVVYFDEEGKVVRLRPPKGNKQPTTDSTLSPEGAPPVEK